MPAVSEILLEAGANWKPGTELPGTELNAGLDAFLAMSLRNCPVSVLVVGCLYLAVGAMGLVRHFPRPMVFHQDDIWILLTELLAVVAGVFLLLGCNWARWMAVAWMAFHVAISWPVMGQLAVHALILAGITWLLFRADARQFFAARHSGAS